MNLQDQVQKMLEGEQKSREIALTWLYDEVGEELREVAPHIWGTGDQGCEGTGDSTITVAGDYGRPGNIYYRWRRHLDVFDEQKNEYPGFYFSEIGDNFGGLPVEELQGSNFWYLVRCVLDWLPVVLKIMEEKSISRAALLAKLA